LFKVWQGGHCSPFCLLNLHGHFQEWKNMKSLGFLEGSTFLASKTIELLEMWSKMADSDLVLAEALAGQELGATQPIGEIVPPLILMSHSHGFFLSQ
jgi:hypothetical protein